MSGCLGLWLSGCLLVFQERAASEGSLHCLFIHVLLSLALPTAPLSGSKSIQMNNLLLTPASLEAIMAASSPANSVCSSPPFKSAGRGHGPRAGVTPPRTCSTCSACSTYVL
ncbi:hypothetical protein B0H67DRAFT_183544 [Lasiosphaeris hirsuta]|uniref:Secreted protein n=1 Tax=Lasiosphaeris hirsuta TaxID=260670 RepID=A0AA40AQU4_9PEZI|nr:hypothetical protein B0H67DRAFT_183544 [Lasiosphaeris hirsuta]